MKTLLRIFALAVLFGAATGAFAQHSLQLDDGHGHTSILTSQGSDALDMFTLPVGGGTLITQPPVGVPALVWLTAANGSLTDLTNNFLGTSDNTPVRMVTGGADAAHTRLWIGTNGRIGIANTNPAGLFANTSNNNLYQAFGTNNQSFNWQVSNGTGQGWVGEFTNSDPTAGANGVAIGVGNNNAGTSVFTLQAPSNVILNVTADGKAIFSNATDVFLNKLTTNGVVHTSGGNGQLGVSAVLLGSEVSGTLPINNGGTNGTATPTAGAVAYGTGTAYAFTLAGTSGQVLTSGGAGTPTWTSQSALAIPFGSITNATQSTTNLVVGNGGSLSATGTGSINATALLGNTWAVPASIGSTTPNAGAFSTLTANTYINFLGTTVQLLLNGVAGTSGQVLTSAGVGNTPTWTSQTALVNTLGGDVSGASNANTINSANAGIGGRLAAGLNTAANNAVNGDVVNHDATLTVATNKLGINLNNANTWTGTQTFGGTVYTPNAPAALVAGNNNDVPFSASSSFFQISGASGAVLTSITGGAVGRTIVLLNVGANPITLKSQQAALGTGTNRLDLPGGGDIILGTKGAATFMYDNTNNWWELVSTN
ncbi:MAG TPA: hypothetical protein VEW28_07470 [Candidatus Kapabacteria bacterium]|nr:hypothetical protein [Candidatus Kapabacteria bacterium]